VTEKRVKTHKKKRREKRNIYINIYVYITHRKERREKKY
jgi:hypothetical protein